MEKTPILHFKAFQDPLRNRLRVLHHLRLLAFSRLDILSCIVRDVDGDDNVCFLLLEAQEDEVDGHKVGLFTPGGRRRRRGLDVSQGVDGVVSVRLLVRSRKGGKEGRKEGRVIARDKAASLDGVHASNAIYIYSYTYKRTLSECFLS